MPDRISITARGQANAACHKPDRSDLTLFRMLMFMLGSWVGGVWVAWGLTGYIAETICAGSTWQWVWLIAAAALAVGLGCGLAWEVRAHRLRI